MILNSKNPSSNSSSGFLDSTNLKNLEIINSISPTPSSIESHSNSFKLSSLIQDTLELCKNSNSNADSIQVILVVYDLLPQGKLSNLAWLFGLGLYHSAVRIPAIGREIAFGGHHHPHLSGIFSLPIHPNSSNQSALPGLRWLCDLDMGHIKPQSYLPISHHNSFDSLSSLESDDHSTHIKLSPKLNPSSPSNSNSIIKNTYPPPPIKFNIPITKSLATLDSSISDSLPSKSHHQLTQIETLASILHQLDQSPDWRGTSYDLLRRNCNSFSHQLCLLLTGKHAPNWINRAASVGCALPCLVPADWIETPSGLGNEQDQIELSTSSQPSAKTQKMELHPT
ncbi:hypothetical protein O181_065657 [Austropuccinia psidii MF-1]|uniref:PPPDE domain-containing protein n=1 Tax=Austropuccinia psidii MF-1 TaxID=1389203 RepID=A0A9Q3I3H4_9BASI|nr:hypothetical protein [Austropuccinia psidii MF-1]